VAGQDKDATRKAAQLICEDKYLFVCLPFFKVDIHLVGYVKHGQHVSKHGTLYVNLYVPQRGYPEHISPKPAVS